MRDKNYTVLYDQEIHNLLSELPWDQITWNESSDNSMKFKNQLDNILIINAHELVSRKLFPNAKLTYGRVWKGKTKDSENRYYHSDKLWEIKGDLDKPFTNMFVLYYHTNFNGKGGLKFWNRTTNEKEVVIPNFGEMIIIDEREDNIYHRVMECNPNINRYVASFGFNVGIEDGF